MPTVISKLLTPEVAGLTPRSCHKSEDGYNFLTQNHDDILKRLEAGGESRDISALKEHGRLCNIDSICNISQYLLCKSCMVDHLAVDADNLDIDMKNALEETQSVQDRAVISDFISCYKKIVKRTI